MKTSMLAKALLAAALCLAAASGAEDPAQVKKPGARSIIPFTIKVGCNIRSKSGSVLATCFPNELCKYSCRCRSLRKDRFSIICGPTPPLYTGIINRARSVVRIHGGSVYGSTGKLCGCS